MNNCQSSDVTLPAPLPVRRIVLTGGPGAGKTVVSRALAQADPKRFVAVPEAASQIYQQFQTRWDRLDTEGRREIQRRIYALQLQQEEELSRVFPEKIHLLDRGTIDGSAYWPDGPDDYWRTLNTSLEVELARYEKVIWLQTCAVLPGVYDADASNPVRCEAPELAIASGEKVRQLWSAHPSFHEVPACADVMEKIAMVGKIIDT